MAPLDLNNDEAFLNLLSSQRQLLSQLNMESAMRQEQQTFFSQAPQRKRGSFLGGLDPTSLMNRPIIERRGSIDVGLPPDRLSVGIGGSLSMEPIFFNESNTPNTKLSWDMASLAPRVMKRRRSSLGLLSSIIVDEEQQSRRFSLLSNFSKSNDFEIDEIVKDDVFGTDRASEPEIQKTHQLDSSLNLKQLKTQIETFASAMEKSAKSQQVSTIHPHKNLVQVSSELVELTSFWVHFYQRPFMTGIEKWG